MASLYFSIRWGSKSLAQFGIQGGNMDTSFGLAADSGRLHLNGFGIVFRLQNWSCLLVVLTNQYAPGWLAWYRLLSIFQLL
jgi:hypothetical protein